MKRFMFRLSASEDLLASIQDRIKWADNMSEVDSSNRKQVEERVEEVKKFRSMKVPCLSIRLSLFCTYWSFVGCS